MKRTGCKEAGIRNAERIPLCGFLLVVLVAIGCSADASASSSASTAGIEGGRQDDLGREQMLLDKNQQRRDEAMKLHLAARSKVHEEHMNRHRMEDPDEHAVLTDDIRRKFTISRRNLLVEQAPQSVLQTVMMIVIFTFPLAIFVFWLRS